MWQCLICGETYPLAHGVPALFPAHSVFSKTEITARDGTYLGVKPKDRVGKRRFRKRLPAVNGAIGREQLSATLRALFAALPQPAIGLHVGAGETPATASHRFPEVQWLNSDVDFAYGPHIMADVTGLPLPDNSVDAIFCNQVLEHVFDISKAAAELQRVLKPGGLVVVGIPFTYPWHGVPYDFTRLTPCGLRALFPHTALVYLDRESGAWSALASQMDSRLVNLFRRRQLRRAAALASRLLLSSLKYLDHLADEPRHLVTAASLVYVGRKTEVAFSPKEIMAELTGLFGGL